MNGASHGAQHATSPVVQGAQKDNAIARDAHRRAQCLRGLESARSRLDQTELKVIALRTERLALRRGRS